MTKQVKLKGLEIGSTHKTNNCGDIDILDIIDSRNVLVRFKRTNTERFADSRLIRKGLVHDKKQSYSNCGAVLDKVVKHGGVVVKQARVWMSMIDRCYSDKAQIRRPRYKGCVVSDYFMTYSNFEEWCNEQVGFNSLDDFGRSFELDKDLLVKGNKIYSENTCVFIPREINQVLEKANASRGEYPIGVCFDKNRNKYASKVKKFGKVVNLGRYNTVIEAFNAYKQAKEAHLKELAAKWKSQIDERAYLALINYEVHIDD